MKLLFQLALLSICLSSDTLRAKDGDIKKADLKNPDENGIVWCDPRAEPFRLVGFPWIGEDKVYRRLPLEPQWPIPKSVDGLANSTAGGQIHFRCDSPKILIRVRLRRASGMYHMPATGQSGFDLYIGEPGRQLYSKTTRFGTQAKDYEATLFSGTKKSRYFTINFPLYNGVESVEIGIMTNSVIDAPLPFEREGRIVVYGTSITQGGCAARPGMAYTNLLSRRLDTEFVNLGFSGSGKGEPALAKLIGQIDRKRLIVLDYEANAGESIRKTLSPFIDILREQDKEVPILVISKIRYADELNFSSRLDAATARAAFQKNLVEARRAAGDANIHFLDGGSLLGERADECTVDGVHPTDLGFMKMADGIEPVLRRILR